MQALESGDLKQIAAASVAFIPGVPNDASLYAKGGAGLTKGSIASNIQNIDFGMKIPDDMKRELLGQAMKQGHGFHSMISKIQKEESPAFQKEFANAIGKMAASDKKTQGNIKAGLTKTLKKRVGNLGAASKKLESYKIAT